MQPEQAYTFGFESLVDAHGFVVVYPSMLNLDGQRMGWAYGADLPYFTAIVRHLEKDLGVEPGRIFVCGHSEGGTMALFLQNELDLFAAAGAVAAGVGNLNQWSMGRRGHPTMLIWNRADPVLAAFGGGEQRYRNETVSVLRRGGTPYPSAYLTLPANAVVKAAEMLRYPPEDAAPELRELLWRTEPGTHDWPRRPMMTFDAVEELLKFFTNATATRRADRGRQLRVRP